MSKTVNFRLLILATLFGFLGGALSSIAVPQLAFAQDEPVELITAREFRIVDEDGNVVGILGAAPALRRQVTVREKDGVVTQSNTPSHGKIMLFDSDGNTIWAEPRGLVHPLASGASR